MSYNNELVRFKNRGYVFKELITNNERQRMELANACGMTKMTISKIVSDFLEKDIVVETSKSSGEDGKCGRKASILSLSPGAKKIVGLLIRHEYVSAALCDCQLNVIRAETVRFTECDMDFLINTIYELVDRIIEDREVWGIGVGSIGPVDAENGMILNPPGFYGLKNIPIVKLLKKRYEVPVYLDYHYNSAARAEKYFGYGRNYKNFLLLGVTEGLGLACVVDGKILSRMTGTSSEFGHITIDRNGRKCSCGSRGCIGRYVEFTSEQGTWQAVKDLCAALLGVCNLLNPHAIIVRDQLSCLNKEHLRWMQEDLSTKLSMSEYHKIEVLLSKLNDKLEVTNCAANILGRLFSGDIEI